MILGEAIALIDQKSLRSPKRKLGEEVKQVHPEMEKEGEDNLEQLIAELQIEENILLKAYQEKRRRLKDLIKEFQDDFVSPEKEVGET